MTKWISEAKKHIGLREISGTNDHPLLLSWWIGFSAKWLYKQAWCGLFVAHCIKYAGYTTPKNWYRAKEWLNWGVEIPAPCYGCIVVFSRTGGGHVGFCVGRDSKDRIMVLGGNQGNAVSIAPFDTSRVDGYRMPSGSMSRSVLPLISSTMKSSTNEA